MLTLTLLSRTLIIYHSLFLVFFFFNDTATTEIYTLSLHDALPILDPSTDHGATASAALVDGAGLRGRWPKRRSEEHTSELQSQFHLVCRLLLEKKKNKKNNPKNIQVIN